MNQKKKNTHIQRERNRMNIGDGSIEKQEKTEREKKYSKRKKREAPARGTYLIKAVI